MNMLSLDKDAVLKLALPLIRRFEGCHTTPYADIAGIATIGYGTTRYPDGRAVSLADPPCREAEAQDWLAADAAAKAKALARLLTRLPSPAQEAAMLSLAYNIGLGAFAGSSLLRRFNAGDIAGAANAFLLWDKAKIGGRLVEVAGLTARRKAEHDLFLSGAS